MIPILGTSQVKMNMMIGQMLKTKLCNCLRMVEWVQILIGDTDDWGMLQELNLERGIKDDTFSTHSLAPYYVRLRNYEG